MWSSSSSLKDERRSGERISLRIRLGGGKSPCVSHLDRFSILLRCGYVYTTARNEEDEVKRKLTANQTTGGQRYVRLLR